MRVQQKDSDVFVMILMLLKSIMSQYDILYPRELLPLIINNVLHVEFKLYPREYLTTREHCISTWLQEFGKVFIEQGCTLNPISAHTFKETTIKDILSSIDPPKLIYSNNCKGNHNF